MPNDEALQFDRLDGMSIATPSWQAPSTARPCGAIVAADGHGTVAAITFERAPGFEIPELELSLPTVATVVRRGVPRVTPGTPIASSAELAAIKIGSNQIVTAMSGTQPLKREMITATLSLSEIASCLSGPDGAAYLATTQKGRASVAHGAAR